MVQRFIGRSRTGALYGSRISNPNQYNGVTSVTTKGYLRGGPELIAQLNRLGAAMSEEAMAQAVLAGGEVLRERWSAMVPVDDANYKRSITALSSAGHIGATGVVFPDEVPGLDWEDQPGAYAARLEFGTLAYSKAALKRGTAGAGRVRTAQPSLRPAFDSCVGNMISAIEDELRDIIEGAI